MPGHFPARNERFTLISRGKKKRLGTTCAPLFKEEVGERRGVGRGVDGDEGYTRGYLPSLMEPLAGVQSGGERRGRE